MLRRWICVGTVMSFVITAAASWAFAQPRPVRQHAYSSDPTGIKVVFSLGSGLIMRDSLGGAIVLAYTEAEFDSVYRDNPVGQFITAERRQLSRSLADSVQQEVSLVMLVMKNAKKSSGTFQLLTTDGYGLQQGGQETPALGLSKNLVVQPGDADFAYIIFSRRDFTVNDSLYIKIRPRR